MAHVQKPDFVFRRSGRVHLNRRWASVQSTTGSRVVRISGSNAGYTMFRGSVKSTGYPFHSPVSPLHFPSRASPCAITFQLESRTRFEPVIEGLYILLTQSRLRLSLSVATNNLYEHPAGFKPAILSVKSHMYEGNRKSKIRCFIATNVVLTALCESDSTC